MKKPGIRLRCLFPSASSREEGTAAQVPCCGRARGDEHKRSRKVVLLLETVRGAWQKGLPNPNDASVRCGGKRLHRVLASHSFDPLLLSACRQHTPRKPRALRAFYATAAATATAADVCSFYSSAQAHVGAEGGVATILANGSGGRACFDGATAATAAAASTTGSLRVIFLLERSSMKICGEENVDPTQPQRSRRRRRPARISFCPGRSRRCHTFGEQDHWEQGWR